MKKKDSASGKKITRTSKGKPGLLSRRALAGRAAGAIAAAAVGTGVLGSKALAANPNPVAGQPTFGVPGMTPNASGQQAQFLGKSNAFMRDTYPKFAKLVARAWIDPEFSRQLHADPAGEMRKAGIPVPANVRIDPGQFAIAPKPPELTLEMLRGPGALAAGSAVSCLGTAGTFSCPACTLGTAGCYHGAS